MFLLSYRIVVRRVACGAVVPSPSFSAFICRLVDLVQQQYEHVAAEFEDLDEGHKREAEPQAENSAQIRYVLD